MTAVLSRASSHGTGKPVLKSVALNCTINRKHDAVDDRACGRSAIELLAVWAIFVLHAGFLIPEINEPNYLAKAKHYWDPSWCPNDFFLLTSDAHVVFYWSFGWLTLLMPLPAVAWVGRLVTCAMMAYGWRRLSRNLAPTFGYATLSAGLLVALNSRFHMAGEWVVGGFEAKGPAYAFVFLALASIVANRWNWAWLLLGIATAFHALVGGWSIIVAGIAWCFLWNDVNRPRLRDQWQGLVGGALLSLPGIVPLSWLDRGVDPQITRQAMQIQVFGRLPHHLNPLAFVFQSEPPYVTWFAIRFGMMVGVCCLLAASGGICDGRDVGCRDRYCDRTGDTCGSVTCGAAVANLLVSIAGRDPAGRRGADGDDDDRQIAIAGAALGRIWAGGRHRAGRGASGREDVDEY